MFPIPTGRPWFLGSFAIYAPDLQLARQVHELVVSGQRQQASGTILLGSGHQIGWVNMAYKGLRDDGQ